MTDIKKRRSNKALLAQNRGTPVKRFPGPVIGGHDTNIVLTCPVPFLTTALSFVLG